MSSRTTWYILIPTLAVSGLLFVVGLSGAWVVHQANRKVSDLLDEKLAAEQSAGRLVLAIRELRLKLDLFVDTGDSSHLDAAEIPLGVIGEELHRGPSRETLGDATGDLPDESSDNLRYDDLLAALNDFQPPFAQLSAQPPNIQSGQSQRAGARELIAFLNDGLLAPAEKLLKQRQQTATDASRQNQVVAQRIGLGLLLLGVCGAAAGMLIGFGVARSVRRSLVEISVPVLDIAGRLNEVVGPIQVSANTDLSQLDDSLRMLAEKTADVVKRLQTSQQQSVRREHLAAVGQLAAGLAHELRNPLMSMKLIVQTAAERPPAPYGFGLESRDLAVIEEEITRLEKMLQTFLDFARPPRPAKRAVEVKLLIQKTLDVVRLRAEQQGVQLHFSSSPDSCCRERHAATGRERHAATSHRPLWIDADESQMRQVLLNLLLNALDVLPGGGNIWLTVEPAAKPPDVVIRVADDGPGLSPEVAERVFDPFVSTKTTGIGLGLSICRRIIESHDGCITARNSSESESRTGAVFTIQLPLSPRGAGALNNGARLPQERKRHAHTAGH